MMTLSSLKVDINTQSVQQLMLHLSLNAHYVTNRQNSQQLHISVHVLKACGFCETRLTFLLKYPFAQSVLDKLTTNPLNDHIPFTTTILSPVDTLSKDGELSLPCLADFHFPR